MLNSAYKLPERPTGPDPSRVAAHADTTLYFACACADVDAAYARLRAKGLNIREPTAARYGMKQRYIRDLDGYPICFRWPEKP